MKTKPEQILFILSKTYPDAKCALNFKSEWELLVATILSAQCTDDRVNQVTKELFSTFPTIKQYQEVDLSMLEKIIRSTGFYKQKSKYIKAAANKIIEDFAGIVPNNMDQLLQIPGVARKTANVVLSIGFGINQGVVVDTHVRRLSMRLGLTDFDDPIRIEKDLMSKYLDKDWERISTLLIHHGRKLCKARNPKCDLCPLQNICPSTQVLIN